jgi:hypothetical protein
MGWKDFLASMEMVVVVVAALADFFEKESEGCGANAADLSEFVSQSWIWLDLGGAESDVTAKQIESEQATKNSEGGRKRGYMKPPKADDG